MPAPYAHQNRWVFVTTGTTPKNGTLSSTLADTQIPRPSQAQRTVIKRHVMRDIGSSRRKAKVKSSNTHKTQRKRVSPPATSDLISQSIPSIVNLFQPIEAGYNSSVYTENRALPSMSIPSSLDILFVGPIEVEYDSRCIFGHMFSNGLPSCFHIYRDKWYPMCVTDAAAFHQMLSTYAMHLLLWQIGHKNILNRYILSHHADALASVRCRLGSLGEKSLEGVLTAIAALACYAHLSGDSSTWMIHMSAISCIIYPKRKSLQASNPGLLSLLQWVDIIGSYALDMPPLLDTLGDQFQDATDSLQPDTDLVNLPNTLRTSLPAPLAHAFRSLVLLNERLVQWHLAVGSSIWDNPLEIDKLVNPLVRQLLSPMCRSDSRLDAPVSSCSRSATILYLAELRRRSGVSPVLTDAHVHKLREQLEVSKTLGIMEPVLHLWMLATGAIESNSLSDQSYFYKELAPVMLKLDVASLKELTEILGKVVWFDAIFEGQIGRIFNIVKTEFLDLL